MGLYWRFSSNIFGRVLAGFYKKSLSPDDMDTVVYGVISFPKIHKEAFVNDAVSDAGS